VLPVWSHGGSSSGNTCRVGSSRAASSNAPTGKCVSVAKLATSQVNVDPHLAQNPRRVLPGVESNLVSRAFERHVHRSRRAAMLATTFVMAPIYPFRLTGRDKADRAAQAASCELLGSATHDRFSASAGNFNSSIRLAKLPKVLIFCSAAIYVVGEVIRELCIDPLGLTATAAADGLGVLRRTLSRSSTGMQGFLPICPFDCRRRSGVPRKSWLQLQLQYDLRDAEQRSEKIRVKHFPMPAAG
jgi:antitoxin HigA-1